MKKEMLTRPFPPELVKHRQGQGGKVLSYLETHTVITRLNEGCDDWSFEIVRHEIVEDEVIVVGKLVADGVVKMAFGGASISRDREGRILELGDTAKSAASDCLKKAASLLGVGLELYAGAGASPASRAAVPSRAEPDIDNRLTARQLTAIHGAARRRGIAPVRLSAMLHERWGKESPQYLSRKEASDLLTELSGANGAHR